MLRVFVCFTLAAAILMAACSSQPSGSRDGVYNGRVYFSGKDYGTLIGDTNFHIAMYDALGDRMHPEMPGAFADLVAFGKFYCAVKSELEDGASHQEIAAAAGNRYHAIALYSSADQIMARDVAAEVARFTLCPDDYPNPYAGTSGQFRAMR